MTSYTKAESKNSIFPGLQKSRSSSFVRKRQIDVAESRWWATCDGYVLHYK